MATRTTNLNLIKPDYDDSADIMDINGDMDVLDSVVGGAVGYIDHLEDNGVTAASIVADNGYITHLVTHDVTAESIVSDHGTISSLSTTYLTTDFLNANVAWIENGTIKNAAINDAMINDVSANKMTSGTLDAGNVYIINLNAKNLNVDYINGLPVIGGQYTEVDKTQAGYSSMDPVEEGWYERQANNAFILSSDTSVDPNKTYYQLGFTVVASQAYADQLYQELSDRIDGTIDTWTGDYVPLATNAPANTWTTTDAKNEHIGDVFIVTGSSLPEEGYCYRWSRDNTQNPPLYSWVLIQDSSLADLLVRVQELEQFERKTVVWETQADGQISTIIQEQNTVAAVVGSNMVVESVQIWCRTSGSSPSVPSNPSVPITNTSDTPNDGVWTLSVPQYDSSMPNTFYCWQYKRATGQLAGDPPVPTYTYGWSAAIRDDTVGNANRGVAETTVLWYTKATSSPLPAVPNARVTDDDASHHNAWVTVVPVYDPTNGHYFYCHQYRMANGSYSWDSTAVYDGTTSKAMADSDYAKGQLTTLFESYTVNSLVEYADGVERDITKVTNVVEYGGANLLPVTEGELYGIDSEHAATYGGLKIVYEGEGWFSVSGVRSGSTEVVVPLWANASGNYSSPVNNLVPQSGNEDISVSVETSGIPFIPGADASHSSHVDVFFQQGAGDATLQFGGFNSYFSYSGKPTSYVSQVSYVIGVDATSSNAVNGRFRVKLERGRIPTAWEYSNADSTYTSNTVNSVKQTADGNSASIRSLETSVESIANPNVGAFYAHPLSDVYDSSTNPGGYWYSQPTHHTELSDGWAHVSMDNSSGSGAIYANVRPLNGKIPAANGTLMIEVNGLTGTFSSGNLWFNAAGTSGSLVPEMVNDDGTTGISANGVYRHKLKTSSNVNPTVWMRSWFGLSAGCSAEFDARLSFYTGEYDGPYKPYVDQTLIERMSVNETSITQTKDSITSLASNTEYYTAPDGTSQQNMMYSAISQNTTNIGLKVSKDAVIASINASTERDEHGSTIQISADKVNIAGAAIFSNGGAYDIATTVVSSQTQWYSSTSPTTKSGGSWSATQPAVTAGRYIWQRELVTYANGNTTYLPSSDGVCTQAQTDLSSYSTTTDMNTAIGNAVAAEAEARKAIYGTSDTAADTTKKAVSCGGFSLYSGAQVTVRFSSANTVSAPTLDVNGTGEKDIWVAGAATSGTNMLLWGAGAIITFSYDGTQWHAVSEPRPWYGPCTTAAGTAAKTSSIPGAVVCKGATFSITMTNANTVASPTLNISSSGAKSIQMAGAALAADSQYNWTAGATVDFAFDGQYYQGGDASALAKAKSAQDAAGAAQTTADGANKRSQRIYYRKTTAGAPTAPTAWLGTSGTGYGNWALHIPPLTHTENGELVKYPYLYTCVQTQTVAQQAAGSACDNSQVLIDDSTTVIDGGNIITGSVTANQIAANTITLGQIDEGAQADILNSNVALADYSVGSERIAGGGAPNLVETGDASRLLSLMIYGNTVQDGTPSPSSPAPIYNVGGINLLDLSKFQAYYTYVTLTVLDNGIRVQSTADGTYGQARVLDLAALGLVSGRTYTLRANISIGSGKALMCTNSGSSINSAASTGWLTLGGWYAVTFQYTPSRDVNFAFYCTDATAAVGDVSYTDLSLYEGSDISVPYVPFDSLGIHVLSGWGNLVNPAFDTAGCSINASGVLSSSENFTASWFIPVSTGSYVFSCNAASSSSSNRRIHGYDASRTWTSQIAYANQGQGAVSIQFDVPSGVSYIRISHRSDDELVMVRSASSPETYIPHIESVTPIPLQGNTVGFLHGETRSGVDIPDVVDSISVDGSGHAVMSKGIEKVHYNGTEEWTVSDSSRYIYKSPNIEEHGYRLTQNIGMCSRYPMEQKLNSAMGDKTCKAASRSSSVDEDMYCFVHDTSYTTLSSFESSLSGGMDFMYRKYYAEMVDLGYIDMPDLYDGCRINILSSLEPTVDAGWWTGTGSSFAGEYSDTVRQVGMSSARLDAVESGLQVTVADIGGLQSQVGEQGQTVEDVKSVFNFTSTGLIIGKSDSQMKSELGNTSLRFKSGSSTVLELDGASSIAKAQAFGIGKYKWASVDNGDAIALIYVGQAGMIS